MASNYIGVDSYLSTLSLMTDGDSPIATTFRLPLERLLDNDVHLDARLDTVEALAAATAALAASDTVAGLIETATQAEQETATDVVRAVTPGRQHFHPSAAKFWARVNVSAGVPTLATSYNVTSIIDDAVGVLSVTIATDFSSANWAGSLAFRSTSTPRSAQFTSMSAGSCTATVFDSATAVAADPDAWSIVGFGDH